MLSALPLLAITMGIFVWTVNKCTKKGQGIFAQAGGVVDETFGGIRTTTALNAQEKMTKRHVTRSTKLQT